MSEPKLDLLARVALGLASIVSLALLAGLITLAQMARGPEGGRVPGLLGLAAAPSTLTGSPMNQGAVDRIEKATRTQASSNSPEPSVPEVSSGPESPETFTAQAPLNETAPESSTLEEPKPRRAPRKSKKTKRKKPKPIEPVAEDTTPEEPLAASFKLLPRATTDKATPGRTTLFEVGMEPATESKTMRVHMKMQCKSDKSRWRRYTMKRTGRKLWSAEINFRIEDRGSCRYYFTAQETAAAPEVSLGSRSAPYKVRVR